MIFTRSNSGVANYPIFYDTEFIIYTEGKSVGNKNLDIVLPDVVFYGTIFKKIFANKNVKIKCVGNKHAALAYVKPLREQGSKNSLVLVDRDYDGAKSSILDDPLIIYTYGYSWENDLWTYDLAKDLITDLTSSNINALATLKFTFDILMKRLKLLSVLDASLQLGGQCILNKKLGSCGVSLDMTKKYPLSKIELKRMILKFKTNALFNDTSIKFGLKHFSQLEFNKVIQGHLWEHAVSKVISYKYKCVTNDGLLSNKLVQTLGLAKFKSDPEKYLGPIVFNYYTNEIHSRLTN